ncbi:putative signal transducing protein [Photobacterium sp.]|uniref:putative signal transducing protein n=1 Tax=Photobacterium sp. TaxID=660 RepID=UPI00299EB24B|nr:DUF2007 domain-containing protein [Photobacterium sp.]MDX1302718.1 DUF2007 domain-containing protein [Photobacterium sp.]
MTGQWVKVYSAANNLEAHTLKGMLEGSHIAVRLSGENLGAAAGELPANVVEVGLWVSVEQVLPARRQLEDYEQAEYTQWMCQQCREVNEGQFELCWQCGQDKPSPPIKAG